MSQETEHLNEEINQEVAAILNPPLNARNLFAAFALAGVLANSNTFASANEIAKRAFEYADAMMRHARS